ncbi:MAG: glutamyl-tRNA synthetase [Gaiellales bacterium]|nr:glutamyl-tRNA synthetase [Gaiellales bacterium]
MPPIRLRFAPSPTGPLHLGSAVVAVANALGARSLGGELLLRIDDTDAERTVAEAEQGILDDLAWLGLELTGDLVRQSDRSERHLAAAHDLLAAGHAYRCFCPPSQERYDGRCRTLPRGESERRHDAGEPNVVRFRVPSAEVVVEDATRGAVRFAGDEISDFVLVRGDGRPTFDLATSVDDRDLAITHIVRGEDHLANSARHLLLLRALGAVEPVFAHCPISVGADGERLSARRGAEPLAALRARGVPGEAVVAYAAQLACPAQGGVSEVALFEELARRFSLARLGRGTAHADPAHLAWLGREVLAALPLEELAGRLAEFLPAETPEPVHFALAEAARGASSLGEVANSASELAQRPSGPPPPGPALELFCELRESDARRHLPYTAAVELVDRLRELGASRGLSARDVLHPRRSALTGAPHGLPLPVVVAVLPREEALERCRT